MSRRTHLRNESGTVLVEMALIATLLLTLVVGIADFGFAWRDRITAENATRAGTRTASRLGDDRESDYQLLQSVKAALADVPVASIERVVVFRANSAEVPSAACRAGTPASSGATPCNVYLPSDFDLPASAFAISGAGCASTAPDRFWCPTSRVTDQAAADYLGVWVGLRRDRVAGLLPGDLTISSTAVMRLEPQEG